MPLNLVKPSLHIIQITATHPLHGLTSEPFNLHQQDAIFVVNADVDFQRFGAYAYKAGVTPHLPAGATKKTHSLNLNGQV